MRLLVGCYASLDVGTGAAAAHGATPLPLPPQAEYGPPREFLGAEKPLGLHQHDADEDQRGDDLRQAVEGRQLEPQKWAAALERDDELRQDRHDRGADNAAGDAAHAAEDHHGDPEENRLERELAGREDAQEVAEQPAADASEEGGDREADQARARDMDPGHLRR